MPRFSEIEVDEDGGFRGVDSTKGGTFISNFDLFLIAEARQQGVDFEDLADGFGTGEGTHGDWSGIRDSSNKAVNKMLERALNALFTR